MLSPVVMSRWVQSRTKQRYKTRQFIGWTMHARNTGRDHCRCLQYNRRNKRQVPTITNVPIKRHRNIDNQLVLRQSRWPALANTASIQHRSRTVCLKLLVTRQKRNISCQKRNITSLHVCSSAWCSCFTFATLQRFWLTIINWRGEKAQIGADYDTSMPTRPSPKHQNKPSSINKASIPFRKGQSELLVAEEALRYAYPDMYLFSPGLYLFCFIGPTFQKLQNLRE